MNYEKEIQVIKKLIKTKYPEAEFGDGFSCSCILCFTPQRSKKYKTLLSKESMTPPEIVLETTNGGRFFYSPRMIDEDLVSFFLRHCPEFTPAALSCLALAEELKEIADGHRSSSS
jgi:hypothetical protein